MITVATPAHRAHIVRTLVAAFEADPVLRMLFPAPEEYPPGARAFFGHLFDKRVSRGSIWMAGDALSVAVWEPPNTPATGSLDLPGPAAARMRAYDEAVHAALPSTPFWYLGVLGTHPDHRGKGYGRAVMRAGLERAAAEKLPAYLETSTAQNVTMYERAGWKVAAKLTEPVPTWVMMQ
ncbi:GNAT family N-acetyltransferase [Kineosporia sp. NBRC 101731]|uniref:GNAT family N-acetyltransferase n=1 Tax=Kineosporia sp. NBRC 101731 TaxID=3032199 RepID=UPI0025545074|nr:GNAT family N-acetyltransferase [Kineosporia sp. NBRC 101731]